MGPIQNVMQEFILRGLIIYHYFTQGQNLWPLKQIYIFFESQWEVANYAGCKLKLLSYIQRIFRPFLKAQAEKLMPYSQISFKSWFTNVS